MKIHQPEELRNIFRSVHVTREGKTIDFYKAIEKIINVITALKAKKRKIFLIGNGGSASIASHIATDFLKNTATAAAAFNDASLITCLSNDLGYEYVFEKPLELLAEKNDVLFSISSSGKSKNILNATAKARQKGCFIVTCSGFLKDNPLRKMGDLNFYFPSKSYGFIEITHLAILHCIVDCLIEKRSHG